MRTLGKWLGRILLTLLLAAVAVGVWKREEITRLLAVNSLFEEEKIVANFSNMNAAFLNRPVSRGEGSVSELPVGAQMTLPEGAEDWIESADVTSLLVLKDGEIRFEDYYQDTSPTDRRISWSIAKSYLSVLFGILLDEGAIASLDDPVTKYAPSLTRTAYDGTSIKDVLTMQSGVVFDEDYFDQKSDINRMGRAIALGGTLDGFTASFTETDQAPGEAWRYVSIDTHVIGMVIRGATGRDVASLLSEKVVAPLGLETEPYYLTDGEAVAFVLGGLNFTTRDYARFGQMVAQDGEWQGAQIVPTDWLRASTSPQANTAPEKRQYGYQWWMPFDARDGEFFGHGIYGQYVYVDRPANVVIVVTATDREFRQSEVYHSNIAMFRAIAEAFDG